MTVTIFLTAVSIFAAWVFEYLRRIEKNAAARAIISHALAELRRLLASSDIECEITRTSVSLGLKPRLTHYLRLRNVKRRLEMNLSLIVSDAGAYYEFHRRADEDGPIIGQSSWSFSGPLSYFDEYATRHAWHSVSSWLENTDRSVEMFFDSAVAMWISTHDVEPSDKRRLRISRGSNDKRFAWSSY